MVSGSLHLMKVTVERWAWKYSSTANASGTIQNYNIRRRSKAIAIKNPWFVRMRERLRTLSPKIFSMRKIAEWEVDVAEVRG